VTADPVAVASQVADALQACGIRYVVGGSLASSFSGEPRSTLDVDMLVSITTAEIPRLIDALGEQFHADDEAFRRAVRDRSSVNVIHLPTATKIDLSMMGGFHREIKSDGRTIRRVGSTRASLRVMA
jgi:hypothetical protein